MAWGSTVVVPEMGQIRSFLVQPLQLDSSVGVVELVAVVELVVGAVVEQVELRYSVDLLFPNTSNILAMTLPPPESEGRSTNSNPQPALSFFSCDLLLKNMGEMRMR